MKVTERQFQACLRTNFAAFAQKAFNELNPGKRYLHNWHIEVIAQALQGAFEGKVRRLIINLPPRSLKSHLASISFTAWFLGRRPEAEIICASYGQDLANKLASDSRRLVTSSWYQRLFPGMKLDSRQLLHDFATTRHGCRLATSVGGASTGRGGEIIIIDDPMKPLEAFYEKQRKAVNDWYDHTLFSRINEKQTGCIILIMQRLHEDDLVGHVLKHGEWQVLKFPAIAEETERHVVRTLCGPREFVRSQGEALHPEREPLETLAETREILGEFNFLAQYQQAPTSLEGGIVKAEWFLRFTPEQRPQSFELVLQSWDTGSKTSDQNSFSVCTTWGLKDKHLYLLHVFCQRLNYPDLRRAVKQHAEIHKPQNILIEDKSSGTQLIQDLRQEGIHGITRCEPQTNKELRLQSVSTMIENGFVHVPEQAPWLPKYLHEMVVFPRATFDDQVDSTSQALDWIRRRSSRSPMLEVIRVKAEHASFGSHSNALQQPRRVSSFGRW